MKNPILPLILLNILSGVGSAIMFVVSDFNLVWLGAFLTTFPLPFFLMVLSNALSIARTSQRLPLIQLISITGVAIVAYFTYQSIDALSIHNYITIGLAIFGAVFVQWYVWSFSFYNREKSQQIVKGQALPNIQVKRLNKETVDAASFKGNKTLLVFFRANWCPFCMNQLKEVLAQADRLRKAGVQVKFISNQGYKNSTDLTEKLNLPAHFEILQDDDLKAAKTLHIEDIGGSPTGMPGYPEDTVMATVIALDENGNVIFGDETDNYRVRPHPDTFLPVFEK